MAGSLSVFKVTSEIGKLKTDKHVVLTGAVPKQSDLAAYGISSKLDQPKTEFKFVEEKAGFRKYSVHQESNTIFEQIKVYKWDFLEDGNVVGENSVYTNKGYQRISDFDILVDVAGKLIYLFTKKDDAILVMNRLDKNGVVKSEPYEIDLSKISLVPEIIDEWGVWLDDIGDAVKRAMFGTKVKKLTEGKEEYVTTYIVTYEHGDIQLSLTISRDGRISTNSKGITNKALLKIFENLKKRIEEKEAPSVD